jgi:hypothetical protein
MAEGAPPVTVMVKVWLLSPPPGLVSLLDAAAMEGRLYAGTNLSAAEFMQ